MLRIRSPQTSFYGSYLYDRIITTDHLLRKIDQVVDFSFVAELLRDRYTPDFGRPAEDPEFMLRLCLLQYLYGDSDRGVIENAKVNLMVLPLVYERMENKFKSPFLVVKGRLSRREGTDNVVVEQVRPLNALEKAPSSKDWH